MNGDLLGLTQRNGGGLHQQAAHVGDGIGQQRCDDLTGNTGQGSQESAVTRQGEVVLYLGEVLGGALALHGVSLGGAEHQQLLLVALAGIGIGHIVHHGLIVLVVSDTVGQAAIVFHRHDPARGDQVVAGNLAHLHVCAVNSEIVIGNAIQSQRHLSFSSFLTPQPR